MTHELKCWPEPFAAILSGEKRHEIRRTDRTFMVGHTLRLREWVPEPCARGTSASHACARCLAGGCGGRYTGREVTARVTYKSDAATWGLPADLCVMSIEVMP